MKKILLFLSFLLMSISLFSSEEPCKTLVFTSETMQTNIQNYTSTWTTIVDDFTWSLTNFNNNNRGWGAIKCGPKGDTNNTASIISSMISEPITSVSITIDAITNGSITSIKLYMSSSTTFSGNGISFGGISTSGTKTVTITNPAINQYYKLEFITNNNTPSGKSGKNGVITLSQVIYYCENETPTTYTVTYDANGGTGTMTDVNSPYNSGATVTVLENTFTRDDYTFDRWNTQAGGGGTDYGEGDEFTISDNTTLYAQWIEDDTQSSDPSVGRLVFELLTDINDLQDGDSIIILDKDNTYAMGAQKTNNRDASNTFDIVGDDVEVTDNSIQIIRADTVGGTNKWKLVVGDENYLYAASSSSNYLKTKATNDANGQWSISIANNIATIIAQGSNTRNKMEYNMSSELFACYSKSEQTPLKIYKKIPCDENYSVFFKNNYSNYDTIEIPSCVRRMHELPTNPSDGSMPCGLTAKFVGWSKSEITGGAEKPDDLFRTLQQSPNINSNDTFHAVFAIKNDAVETPVSANFVFKTKHWGDSDNSWTGSKDGYSKNSQGVQVTKKDDYQNAGATTKISYYKITSIVVTYSTNPKSGTGAINVKIGSTSLGNKSVTKDGGSTDRALTYTPASAMTGTVSFSVTCSDNSIYIKSIQINYTDYEHDYYQTYCTDTLKVGQSWNSGTWSLSRAPYINERAVILQPVSVDIEHATAKEIVISPSGKLTIEANKGLEVKDTISTLNGSHKATSPTDLVLESSAGGNASLIFNNNNGDSATVYLYSKATYPGLDGSNADWQYIGTTMTNLNALYNYYGSWLYKWVGGTEKWQAVPNGGMMEAWNGYCITQSEIACHETSGQLVPTTSKTLDIYAPHTVVANSWTAPIHIGAFRDEDFDNISDKRIYLFNTGFDPGGDSAVYTTRHNSPGTYVVIPIHAAPYLDKDSLIPSQQGFFVKTNTNGHLILDYDRIVRTGGSGDIVAGPLRAPRRADADDRPNVLKIYANGSRFSDRLTILEREYFTTSLDNGWDGDKMGFSNLAPSIYVINEDGSYDEVSAIPDYEGTLIGFKAGTDIAYSITFDYDGDETIYLNDLLTQTSTLIDNESKYVFTSDGSEEVRFVISATPYAGVATDIDKLIEQSNTTHKFLYNGNLYILKNNCIFNIVGSLIK